MIIDNCTTNEYLSNSYSCFVWKWKLLEAKGLNDKTEELYFCATNIPHNQMNVCLVENSVI